VGKVVGLGEVRRFVLANGPGEAAAAWVAGLQLGVIAFWQLEAAGLSRTAIAGHARRGLLHRLYRGVYVFGHAKLLPGGQELAAVLACGKGAMVSHRSAAALYGLCVPPQAAVHLTVERRSCRSRRRLRVHNVERIDRRDCGLLRGIPITAPARTLVDFASDARSDELERAIAEAFVLRLVNEPELEAAAGRARNHRGVAALRAELRREAGPQLTRREGERRMLKLLRDAGLPQPLTNTKVEGFEVDFLWPDQKLIVEFDGFQFHGHRAAFERDRRRDQRQIAAGYRVIRITWRQLAEEPLTVVATIARALGI
jgi:very-short-patch-repair endonuclease